MVIKDSLSLQDIHNVQYTNRVEKAFERVTTGLKINSASDDPPAAVISLSLNAKVSGLTQGVENANDGLLVVDSTKKALTSQKDILNEIKAQLQIAINENASGQETIRVNVQSQLDNLNTIATNSFKDIFTLQESNQSTNPSIISNLFLSQETSVNTPSVQANTVGLDLENLRTLGSGSFDFTTLTSEIDKVTTALNNLDDIESLFDTTKEELGVSINALTHIKESSQMARDDLIKADLSKEENIVQAFEILVESSQFAVVQAHAVQERVLNLLTSVPDYVPNEQNNNNNFTEIKQSSENQNSSSNINIETTSFEN